MTPNKIVVFSSKMVVKSAIDDRLLLLLQSSTSNDDNQQDGNAIVGIDSIQIQGKTGNTGSTQIQHFDT